MPNRHTTLRTIQETLASFETGSFAANAETLFNALGYKSDKTYTLEHSDYQSFYADFAQSTDTFRPDKASTDAWQSVDILFQLADDDLEHTQTALFEPKALEQERFNSFVFMAIELAPRANGYTRTALAQITREVNKCFLMPIVMLFKHDDTLTLAVIQRRQNKREGNKDVLEKVILVKDINTKQPHRAHLEILTDLSLEELTVRHKHRINNFETLFKVWQDALDTTELNKKFYKELSNWYFWALRHAKFPELPKTANPSEQQNNRTETALIRLITRLIFVWFIKEKGLVPEQLFDKERVNAHLTPEHQVEGKNSSDTGSSYYRAILQNLFFATLNTERNRDLSGSRDFKVESKKGQRSNKEYMAHTRYRYRTYFKDPDAALELFDPIPFLNGGLFECLDRAAAESASGSEMRIDGFSDRQDRQATLPDFLFFGEADVDLNEVYGTNRKRSEHVMGIVRIFERYKFTIDENTPIEEEVALDPELLGKVFENLLASYNPETSTTARKQTGSFYTPREIVNYMVDESLIAYLTTPLSERMSQEDAERQLRELFAYDTHNPFDEEDTTRLINSIDHLKILDPACGSGAFPIGTLQRLVAILGKLDPDNERWKAQQLEREIAPVQRDIRTAKRISDDEARELATKQLESRLTQIRRAFEENDHDYARKLFLIENCIYGVDIQPIAVQIAKLRCFIALIVDQRVDEHAENRGVLPLPNLETKFVAANTLIGIDKPAQATFEDPALTAKQDELKQLRHEHFQARRWQKKKALREQDKKLREEIAELLKGGVFKGQEDTAENLANWNPYDQNASAGFFDAEWMFGVTDGFGVVIGNPPYVISKDKQLRQIYKESVFGRPNLYGFFIHKSLSSLLSESGILIFINPRTLLTDAYFKALRAFILRHGHILLILNIVNRRNVFESVLQSTIVNMIAKNSSTETVRIKNIQTKAEIYLSKDMIVSKNEFVFGSPDEPTFVIGESRITYNLFRKLTTVKSMSKNGLSFTTGKVQWDKYKAILSPSPKEGAIRLIWAENVQRYHFADAKLRKDRLFINGELKSGSPIREETIVVQRTTAIEQPFRIIAMLVDPSKFGYPIQAENNTSYLATNIEKIPLRFLLGVLNSKFMDFIFRHINSNTHVSGGELNSLPLARLSGTKPSIELVDQITELVNQILQSKATDSKASTIRLEKQIDALVYALYDLTEDEIAIVEGTA
jgi:23S rRNA G2445 N2-methylase RlmL